MIWKVTGDSGGGWMACGCYSKRGEEYFIVANGKELNSMCQKHANNPQDFKVIKVPEDYQDDGVLPIK